MSSDGTNSLLSGQHHSEKKGRVDRIQVATDLDSAKGEEEQPLSIKSF